MFTVKTLSKDELSISPTETPQILDAIFLGLKADRLVEYKLVDFEEIPDPNSIFSFKISYLSEKDRYSIIQLSKCGKELKIFLETQNPCGFSASEYEFKFYPTSALFSAEHKEIVEYAHSNLFMLAFIVLRISCGFDFTVTRDGKKLDTDSPIIALYEACSDTEKRSTTITYCEEDSFEANEVNIFVSKDTGLAQVEGHGVTPLSLTLTEVLVKMINPNFKVQYVVK